LKKPVHDLSRGCSSSDIFNVATIAAMQKWAFVQTFKSDFEIANTIYVMC